MAYLLILLVLQPSKVSYRMAFQLAGILLGIGMGIISLKESHWKAQIIGALILKMGLFLIGLAEWTNESESTEYPKI